MLGCVSCVLFLSMWMKCVICGLCLVCSVLLNYSVSLVRMIRGMVLSRLLARLIEVMLSIISIVVF